VAAVRKNSWRTARARRDQSIVVARCSSLSIPRRTRYYHYDAETYTIVPRGVKHRARARPGTTNPKSRGCRRRGLASWWRIEEEEEGWVEDVCKTQSSSRLAAFLYCPSQTVHPATRRVFPTTDGQVRQTSISIPHGDSRVCATTMRRSEAGVVVVGGGGGGSLDDESFDHMPIHTHSHTYTHTQTHTHTRPESTLRNRCGGTIIIL